jgi:hypothetical protein
VGLGTNFFYVFLKGLWCFGTLLWVLVNCALAFGLRTISDIDLRRPELDDCDGASSLSSFLVHLYIFFSNWACVRSQCRFSFPQSTPPECAGLRREAYLVFSAV